MNNNILNKMLTEKPFKALLRLGIPAIIMALFNEINAIIDTVFLGKFISEQAVAAMAIVFPFHILIAAIVFLFSEGGSIAIGRYLGSQNLQSANKFYNQTISISLVSGILITVVGFLTVPSLLEIFDLDELTYFYAHTYLKFLLFAVPIIMLTMVFSKMLYTEGHSRFLLISTIIQVTSNVILNYFFLAILNMNIAGAALGTSISFAIQCFMLYLFSRSKKTILSLRRNQLRITKAYLKEVIPLGMPTFITMTLLSLTMSIANMLIATFGNDALVVQTIIGNIFSMIASIATGLLSSSVILMAYSVGANNRTRYLKILKNTCILVFTTTTIISLPLVFNAELIASIFTPSINVAQMLTVPAIIYGLALPIIFTTNTILYAMQPIGMENTATSIFFIQQIILYLPLLFILKPLGFNYTISAQPIAEIIGATITIFTIPIFMKHLNKTFQTKKGALL